MIHHRKKSEVRSFDIFKLVVLLILIALLLWFWLSPPSFVQGPDDSGGTAVAADTDSGTDANSGVDETDEPEETTDETTEETEEESPQIDAPELESPVLTDGLEAGDVSLSGSGTPGSTVRIWLDGVDVGTAEVGADGSWSYDLDLEAGSREISLEALDADGNVAATADSLTFDVAAPAITLDIPTLNLIDGSSPGGQPTLSGSGTPGSEVGIVVDGELLGTATVADDGTWSFDVDLAAGDYDVRLQAIDLEGNVAGESEGFGLSFGTPEPDFVLPTFNLPDVGLLGGDVMLSGIGTPGAEIEIVLNGEVVGTAVVADDGTWNFPATLPAGDYELALRTIDGSGTAVETDPFTFSLAPAEIVAPTLDAPADGSSVESGELLFSGTGEPGAEVDILDGDEVIGTAVVSDDGTWTFSYTPDAGDHSYAVRNSGASEAAATSNVSVAAPAESGSDADASTLPADFCKDAEPGIDQGDTYVVAACEWLIKIANRLGIEYTSLIGVNPQIEDPNLIYPGQVINLPPR